LLLSQESQHDQSLQALIAAYPDELAGYDKTDLYWRDGTAMPLSDDNRPKSFAERLRNSSIKDQLLLEYHRGPLVEPPAPDSDPGRFRNTAFFEKMYGNCRKGEVSPHLVQIVWLPKTWGKTIPVTSINGVDRRHSRLGSLRITRALDRNQTVAVSFRRPQGWPTPAFAQRDAKKFSVK
jgi:hypothetical protein